MIKLKLGDKVKVTCTATVVEDPRDMGATCLMLEYGSKSMFSSPKGIVLILCTSESIGDSIKHLVEVNAMLESIQKV